MELAGERMLFVFTAASALLLAGFTGWRLLLRDPASAAERSGFTSLPITSPVIAEIGPGDDGRAPALAEEQVPATG
jgi:hypothetical protein